MSLQYITAYDLGYLQSLPVGVYVVRKFFQLCPLVGLGHIVLASH